MPVDVVTILFVAYFPLIAEKVVGRAGYFSNQLVQFMHYMKPEDYGPYYEAAPVQDVLEIVLPKETVAVVGLAILVVTTLWCVLTTTTEVATPTEVAGTMVTSVAPTNTEVEEIRVAPTNTEVEEIRVAPTNTEVVEGYHLYTIPEESSEDPTGACDAMVASVAPTNTEVEEIRVAPTNTEVVEETSTPKVVFVILHNEIVMMPYWDNNGMWLTGHNGMWLTGQELFMHIKTIKDTTTGTEFNITKENTHGWSVVVPDQEGVFPQPYFYLEKAFSSPHNRDLRMHFDQVTVHGPNIAQEPEPVRRCTFV
jgi:hypothetical protein